MKSSDDPRIKDMLAFEDSLLKAAESKVNNPANINYKPKEYCQISKQDLLDKNNEAAKVAYYGQKLHVSLKLEGDDASKVWNDVLLKIYENPCVYGVKILNPYHDVHSKRPPQAGKEVTIYFVRPEDMPVKMSLASLKREHLKVIQELDALLKQAGVEPSVQPKNQEVPEHNAKDLDKGARGNLKLVTDCIYISPPDQDEKGQYVSSSKRASVDHTYTQDVLDHFRRNEVPYLKLDLLLERIPELRVMAESTPGNGMQELLAAIEGSVLNEDTAKCARSVGELAANLLETSKAKPAKPKFGGLFQPKTKAGDTPFQSLCKLLSTVDDKRMSLVEFREQLDNVVHSQHSNLKP